MTAATITRPAATDLTPAQRRELEIEHAYLSAEYDGILLRAYTDGKPNQEMSEADYEAGRQRMIDLDLMLSDIERQLGIERG